MDSSVVMKVYLQQNKHCQVSWFPAQPTSSESVIFINLMDLTDCQPQKRSTAAQATERPAGVAEAVWCCLRKKILTFSMCNDNNMLIVCSIYLPKSNMFWAVKHFLCCLWKKNNFFSHVGLNSRIFIIPLWQLNSQLKHKLPKLGNNNSEQNNLYIYILYILFVIN